MSRNTPRCHNQHNSHPPLTPQLTHNIISAMMPSWSKEKNLKLQELYESGDIDPHNLTAAYLWAKTVQHFPNFKGKEGNASARNNAIAGLQKKGKQYTFSGSFNNLRLQSAGKCHWLKNKYFAPVSNTWHDFSI